MNTCKNKPFVIAVEGIIGSGKSTLINEILLSNLTAKGFKVAVINEPVELWKVILVLFGNDPKRWGYHFQTKASHDRVKASIKVWEDSHRHSSGDGECNVDIIITDRSIISDTFFMDLLHDSDIVSDMEYEDYQSWWSMWERLVPFQYDLFVYLDTPMEKSMKQLRERNRDGESGITEDYQRRLQSKHDKFFENDSVIVKNKTIPVFRLSTDKELFDIAESITCDIESYFAREFWGLPHNGDNAVIKEDVVRTKKEKAYAFHNKFDSRPWSYGVVKFLKYLKVQQGEIIGEYNGMYEPIECKCRNGHDCYPSLYSFYKGKAMCSLCPSLEKI